jgi:hypothetical protein
MANTNVNAHGHALKAATRTARGGNPDWMAEVEGLPAAEPRSIGLSELLQGDVALTLKTKDGGDVQLSGRIISVLGILLLACASCAFYLIYTTATVATAQRYESEIRARDSAELKTMMRDYQAQVVSGFVTTQAYMAAHTNKVSFMTALLSKEQQRQVREYELTHPMPSPPSPESFKFRENQN